MSCLRHVVGLPVPIYLRICPKKMRMQISWPSQLVMKTNLPTYLFAAFYFTRQGFKQSAIIIDGTCINPCSIFNQETHPGVPSTYVQTHIVDIRASVIFLSFFPPRRGSYIHIRTYLDIHRYTYLHTFTSIE